MNGPQAAREENIMYSDCWGMMDGIKAEDGFPLRVLVRLVSKVPHRLSECPKPSS